MNAMKGLGINDADASSENLMSMMQGMMTNLLSKDILYPSLKEIQMRVSMLVIYQTNFTYALGLLLYCLCIVCRNLYYELYK